MKNGQLNRRASGGRGVMESLARARPRRLDADLAHQGTWPDARYFTDAAEPCPGDGATPPAGSARRPASIAKVAPWAAPGNRKLIAAMSSAIATGAVVAIVLAGARGVVPSDGPAATRTAHSGAGRITFHDLRLHGHWRGRLDYGVSEGVVYLAGSAGSSRGDHISMTTLPPGVRPIRQLHLTVNLGRVGVGVVQVMPDGQVSVFASGNDFTFVSLDGVEFPLGS
jgi:hypothetical protein